MFQKNHLPGEFKLTGSENGLDASTGRQRNFHFDGFVTKIIRRASGLDAQEILLGGRMRFFKFGTGFAVFVIFFAISLIEAFRSADYLWVIFWLAMGFIFWSCDAILRRRSG